MTGIEGLIAGIIFGIVAMVGITAITSRMNKGYEGDMGEALDEHEEAAQPAHGLSFLTDAELVQHVLIRYDMDSLEHELAARLGNAMDRLMRRNDRDRSEDVA
jgi:hypothetical protein